MKFGIQIFGCADIFRRSPDAFFNEVSQMGYKKIEPCIWFGSLDEINDEMRLHFWSVEETGVFNDLMKKYGLYMESFHAFGDLLGNMHEVKTVLHQYQIKNLVLNGPSGNHDKMYPEYLDFVQKVVAEVAEFDTEILIHNGSAEIERKIGNKTFLEAVLEACEGKIGAQVDVGWVRYAGVDPVEFITKIKPFCKSLHYKDIKGNKKELTTDNVCVGLGQGILEVFPIYELGKEYGIPQYVDQDASDGDLMEDLRYSIQLLNSYI